MVNTEPLKPHIINKNIAGVYPIIYQTKEPNREHLVKYFVNFANNHPEHYTNFIISCIEETIKICEEKFRLDIIGALLFKTSRNSVTEHFIEEYFDKMLFKVFENSPEDDRIFRSLVLNYYINDPTKEKFQKILKIFNEYRRSKCPLKIKEDWVIRSIIYRNNLESIKLLLENEIISLDYCVKSALMSNIIKRNPYWDLLNHKDIIEFCVNSGVKFSLDDFPCAALYIGIDSDFYIKYVKSMIFNCTNKQILKTVKDICSKFPIKFNDEIYALIRTFSMLKAKCRADKWYEVIFLYLHFNITFNPDLKPGQKMNVLYLADSLTVKEKQEYLPGLLKIKPSFKNLVLKIFLDKLIDDLSLKIFDKNGEYSCYDSIHDILNSNYLLAKYYIDFKKICRLYRLYKFRRAICKIRVVNHLWRNPPPEGIAYAEAMGRFHKRASQPQKIPACFTPLQIQWYKKGYGQ